MRNLSIFLTIFLLFAADVCGQRVSVLLRELIDLPSPPPMSESDRKRIAAAKYDVTNPPPDDAPIDDLIQYWDTRAARYYFERESSPSPSIETIRRLADAQSQERSVSTDFLKLIRDDQAAADVIKQIYDAKISGNDAGVSWQKEIKAWLKFHSKYYLDELAEDARNIHDHRQYSTIVNEEGLRSLAKFDWERARPLLETLESRTADPRSATLAKILIYRHAVVDSDNAEAEKYRSRLQALVADKKTLAGIRDMSMDALIETDWPGLDDWYLSLMEDETLLSPTDDSNLYSPLNSLAEKYPDKWIPVLAKLVDSPKRAVHNAAVQSLVQFKRRDALLPMLAWLTDPKWADIDWSGSDRTRYMQIVANVDLPESVPGLIWIVQNDEDNINWAARSLAKYKDQRAGPVLRASIGKIKQETYRRDLIEAAIACGGFSDAELVDALKTYAAFMIVPGDPEKLYGGSVYDEAPLPVAISIGLYLADQKTPDEAFVRLVFEEIDALERRQPTIAAKLSEIAARWEGKSVDARMIERVGNGSGGTEEIVTILARRKDIAANSAADLAWLAGKGGLPSAIAAAIRGDAQLLSEQLGRDDETRIAALACSRLLRIDLPINDVDRLQASSNKLLALAAERYLESEDSHEARQMVLARHPGEFRVLGARDSFNPAKQTPSVAAVAIQLLFQSVSMSSFGRRYSESFEKFDKYEEDLQKELRSDEKLKRVYASGGNYLRVYADHATYTWHTDDAIFREKTLTKDELASFERLIAENEIDKLGPTNDCTGELCGIGQFLMIDRTGGRRIYSYSGIGSNLWMETIFWPLRDRDAKPKYNFTGDIAGLETLLSDPSFKPQAIWKSGADLRVLIFDESVESKKDKELMRLNEIDDEREDLTYDDRSANRRKRADEHEFDAYEWHSIVNVKIGDAAAEPDFIPFLRDSRRFPAIGWSDSNHQFWQALSGNFLIRADTDTGDGLWRCSLGYKAKIADGNFRMPVTTPDGKWAIAARTDTTFKEPHYLVRVDLTTGRQSRVNLPAAGYIYPVAYVAAHKKILVYSGTAEYSTAKPTPADYFLLDADTGAVEKVKGEFQPFIAEGFRPLQPTGRPDEYWATLSNRSDRSARIGTYNARTFTFTPLITLGGLILTSNNIWIDEPENKAYIIYRSEYNRESHLISLPLKRPGPTK